VAAVDLPFAEAMTVFAVLTAGLFPIIHIGRPWFFYWLLPLPSQRQMWPNFRSPLLWDVFAVTTYLTVSSVFFYIGLIPDIAAARDAATVGWRKKVYTILALGWRGTDREWKNFTRAYLFLAALATPLVLSVHSVVSWDFAVSIVPGWHTTIFAPYFVAGAILSGVAMVVTLRMPMRKIFGLGRVPDGHALRPAGEAADPDLADRRLRVRHGVLHGLVLRRAVRTRRLLGPRHRGVLVGGVVHDHLQRGRPAAALVQTHSVSSLNAFFLISIFVNIGMWYERFVIIVPSLAHSYEPWKFLNYHMGWTEARSCSAASAGSSCGCFSSCGSSRASPSRRSRRSCRRRSSTTRNGEAAESGADETWSRSYPLATKSTSGDDETTPTGVLGVFPHMDTATDAIRTLRSEGYPLTVYSPDAAARDRGSAGSPGERRPDLHADRRLHRERRRYRARRLGLSWTGR
jgi:hypothetical protein